MTHFARPSRCSSRPLHNVLDGLPQDLHKLVALRGLPILLSLNEVTDDVVWGVQLSKAARALICGHTFTILRVGVVEHALAATS